MSDVRHIEVSADEDGQRLDRWLKKHMPGAPFGLVQKILRTGQVRIDGKRAKPDTRLSEGQSVRLPPLEHKNPGDGYRLSQKDEILIRSLVIYDDGEILAVNKPPGIATQGGSNIERHIDGMLEALSGRDGVKPRLVHRLDRDTSGVLLLARSAAMARSLGKVFSGRHIRKIYWALTAPAPARNEGSIDAPLAKGAGETKDKMVVDAENGQNAFTLYEVVERAGKAAAFVAFWPRTGRTHQIRAHAAHAGFPLIGDEKYGGADGGDLGISVGRLHLHAASISFRHPGTGKSLEIKAPLPDDLVKSWQGLGFSRSVDKALFADIRLF